MTGEHVFLIDNCFQHLPINLQINIYPIYSFCENKFSY